MNKNNPFTSTSLPSVFPGTTPVAPVIAPAVAQGPLARYFAQYIQPRPAASRDALPPGIKAVLDLPLEYFQNLANQKAPADAKPLTNVAFVLDNSSSMAHGKSTTIEGFNAQVGVLREGAKAAGETTFTEVQFSDVVKVRRVASSLDHLVNLTEASYVPEGMTALYDALGDTIAALLQTPRMDSPATATLVTLFTDGGENSSSRYDATILSELVRRLEATGRWTFALVGPRRQVSTLAEMLSVKQTNVASYDPVSLEERAQVFGRMASASANYMSMRSMGVTQACSLYAGDGATNLED